MFSDYLTLMRQKLGMGKPLDGYSMQTPGASLPAPTPWNQATLPVESPMSPWGQRPWNTGVVPPHMGGGATLPPENPWNQTKGPVDWVPKPNGGDLPEENPMHPSGQPRMKPNLWSRY